MEDTLEREVAIAQMVRDAAPAEEPGEITQDNVVHKGDEDIPKMTGTVTSAGYAVIYHTKTGASSKCIKYMLSKKLRLMGEDGLPVFTIYKPGFEPVNGKLLCMLHKDSSNRKYHDSLGLPTCPKDNLLSEFHVKRHMQKRHKLEWQTLEEARVERERQEELAERREQRDFQRKMLGRAVPAGGRRKKT